MYLNFVVRIISVISQEFIGMRYSTDGELKRAMEIVSHTEG